MAKTRPPYDPEFRRRMVELKRSGRKVADLVKEFGVTDQSIRNWELQADRDEGRRKDGYTTDEKAELARLRRENARLRDERDILKKAAAWFAQETISTPNGRSKS